MELKKNPESNLEKKRFLFLQFGLLLSVGLMFSAFEWRTYSEIGTGWSLDDLEEEVFLDLDFEEIIKETPVRPEVPELKIKKVNLFEKLEIIDSDIFEEKDISEIDFDNMDFEMEEEGYESGFKKPDLNKTYLHGELSFNPKFGRRSTDLDSYINNNVRIPTSMKQLPNNTQILIHFTVNKKGEVIDIEVEQANKFDYRLVRNLKSLFSNMPNWVPGMYGTVPVNVRMEQPITIEIRS
jgi:protein TonB